MTQTIKTQKITIQKTMKMKLNSEIAANAPENVAQLVQILILPTPLFQIYLKVLLCLMQTISMHSMLLTMDCTHY